MTKTSIALVFALVLTACTAAPKTANYVLYCTVGNTPTFIGPPMTDMVTNDNTIKIYVNWELTGIHKLSPGESCMVYDKNNSIVQEQQP